MQDQRRSRNTERDDAGKVQQRVSGERVSHAVETDTLEQEIARWEKALEIDGL